MTGREPEPAQRRADAALLGRLLEGLSAWFDIRREVPLAGRCITAVAEFHSRAEKFVLSRSARLWAAESNEYMLFFVVPRLDVPALEDIGALLAAAEAKWVRPHGEHMVTYLSAVVLCRQVAPAAVKPLHRFTQRKSYRFSFHGGSQGRIAAIETGTGLIHRSRDGRPLKKALAKLTEHTAFNEEEAL